MPRWKHSRLHNVEAGDHSDVNLFLYLCYVFWKDVRNRLDDTQMCFPLLYYCAYGLMEESPILATDPGGCSFTGLQWMKAEDPYSRSLEYGEFYYSPGNEHPPTLIMMSSWPFSVPNEIFSNFSLASECVLCSSKFTVSCYMFLKELLNQSG